MKPQPQRRCLAAILTAFTLLLAAGGAQAQTLSIDNVTVGESDGTATVTVVLDTAVVGGFTVVASTGDSGFAAAGEDYTAVPNAHLSFVGTAGEQQSFTVPILEDAFFEFDETLTVELSNLQGTTGVDISATATIAITDNDDFILTIADVIVVESDGTATVPVRLDNPVLGGFALEFSVDDDDDNDDDNPATAGSDYYTAFDLEILSFMGACGRDPNPYGDHRQ